MCWHGPQFVGPRKATRFGGISIRRCAVGNPAPLPLGRARRSILGLPCASESGEVRRNGLSTLRASAGPCSCWMSDKGRIGAHAEAEAGAQITARGELAAQRPRWFSSAHSRCSMKTGPGARPPRECRRACCRPWQRSGVGWRSCPGLASLFRRARSETMRQPHSDRRSASQSEKHIAEAVQAAASIGITERRRPRLASTRDLGATAKAFLVSADECSGAYEP